MVLVLGVLTTSALPTEPTAAFVAIEASPTAAIITTLITTTTTTTLITIPVARALTITAAEVPTPTIATLITEPTAAIITTLITTTTIAGILAVAEATPFAPATLITPLRLALLIATTAKSAASLSVICHGA